ncbi:MAG: hypothetical protein ISQ70_03430 [Pirellulales bacterium]|nr:hypothetical protein [Pirellulales bacterium]
MNAATPSRNHTQARLVAFACCLAVAWLSADHLQAMAADAASDSDLKWTPHRQSRSEPPVPMSMAARPSQAPAPAPAQPIDAVAPAPAAAPRPAQPAARSPVASVVAEPSNPFGPPPQRMAPPSGQIRRPMPRQQPASQPAPGLNISELMSQMMSAAPFTRTPQGEMQTTIYGSETAASRQGMRQPTPTQAAARSGRPDRYAMNSDDLQSVMNPSPADEAEAPSVPAYEDVPSPTGDDMTIMEGPMMMDDGMMVDEMPWTQPHYDPAMERHDFGPSPPPGAAMLPGGTVVSEPGIAGNMWMGEFPGYDPYGCEDDCGFLPMFPSHHHSRLVNWLRRFGKPYYGWRWYRDLNASIGTAGFQNGPDLGLIGNFGFSESLNWAMPLWNAFGLGWQLGVRGVQTNFNSSSISANGQTLLSNTPRNQLFLTTGLFTRAFEGRGLQGGVAWDYLRDNWYDDVDVAQLRGEISYVFGAWELGFWGTGNVRDTDGIFGRRNRTAITADSTDIYAGFYRLYFGDANELKIWGGGTGSQEGIIGTYMRAPMNRSLALEGAFTYLMPGPSQTVPLEPGSSTMLTYTQAAWNVSVNLVFYPACRSRRGLASPYRPLFEVADNGTLIRTLKK